MAAAYLLSKGLGCARHRGKQHKDFDLALDNCAAHAGDEEQGVGVEDGVGGAPLAMATLVRRSQQLLSVVFPAWGVQICWLHTQGPSVRAGPVKQASAWCEVVQCKGPSSITAHKQQQHYKLKGFDLILS